MVFGTRPEAVKIAPVVTELRRCGVEPTIYATGQHTSLLKGTPAENVLADNVNLALPSSNDPLVYARDCGRKLSAVFRVNRPDVIVVQGDTASAYAGACVGKWLEIPVAHVEAGIRTGDPWDPWPEENFRVSIDGIAHERFFATTANLANLRREQVLDCDYPLNHVTGNTGIDALYSHTRPVEYPHKVQDRVLVTLHRRESFGEPLLRIVQGIWKAAQQYPKLEFAWPTHPNPKVQDAAGAMPFARNVVLLAPMDTIPFARVLASSRAVITDSGGVQEEAAALGIPCIVARDKTDRPESVDCGLAKVVGRTESGILQGLDWALGFGARCTPSDCFGDGKAAGRVVEHLLGANDARNVA